MASARSPTLIRSPKSGIGPTMTSMKSSHMKSKKCFEYGLISTPSDIEANIKRCKERIDDGIMPQWWEDKLKRYESRKEQLDELIASESPELSLEIIARIKNLQFIRNWLDEHGDKYRSIQNIDAVIKAYRDKSLGWKEEHVSYWSNGSRVSDLEPFDWERFRNQSDAHGSDTGFWVERVSDSI